MTQNVPGQRKGITTTPRVIVKSDKNLIFERGVIDATYAIDGGNTGKTDELRAGCLMAKLTTSGKWVPAKFTRVKGGTSGSGSGAGDTALTVEDARFFKADDPVSVETAAGTANHTVSSVDYVNNVITMTTAVDNPNEGGLVQGRGALAGSGTVRAILNNFVKLLGIPVHEDAVWRDMTIDQLLISGYVDASQILGDLAGVRASTSVTHYLNHVIWDDQQGG